MIEFQYFNGCPNAEASLKNLKELISDGLINENDLKVTEVPNIDSAESLNFQGSPTILFNGYDIYLEEKPKESNYSCRVYYIDGKQTGILSMDYIKMKLQILGSKPADSTP